MLNTANKIVITNKLFIQAYRMALINVKIPDSAAYKKKSAAGRAKVEDTM